MRKGLIIVLCLTCFYACSKKTGASDKAMNVVETRFNTCHLKDSLGDSSMSYLWSEYDSEHNSILCFQYGGCAIEYFYHDNDHGRRRDTFIVKSGTPFVDEVFDSYRKMTDDNYLSSHLDAKHYRFIHKRISNDNSFYDYFKDQFPTKELFVESFINQFAVNDF